MDFKEATDHLTAALTHEDVAREAGVSVTSVRAARLDSTSSNARTPPPNWRPALARLARERAAELLALADELEREAD